MSWITFAALAALGEQLESTTKRLELASLVAGFLQSLQPEEIPPACDCSSARSSPSGTAGH